MDNSIQKIQIFDFSFNNPELEEEVHTFFNKNRLLPLFTNEHRANHIRVSYNEARSIVKEKGAASKVLIDFADYVNINQNNKSYEEALFKIIYESKSLQGMINKLRRYMEYIKTIEWNYFHNSWNIVWYNKDLR